MDNPDVKEVSMKVFIVGASGVIGTRLIPQLIERGHEVIGTSSHLARQNVYGR